MVIITVKVKTFNLGFVIEELSANNILLKAFHEQEALLQTSSTGAYPLKGRNKHQRQG